ncbi:hypothetical protein C8R47DRAFT_63798 [Mycena vitilis]|nr:hypothetical protein C8R47DRAFT_63798 [Mycena vitilis]
MDEDVPDSDGEEYLPMVPNPMRRTTPPAPPTDSIASFSAKPVAQEPISSSSSGAPRARPKPRPTFKGTAAAAARPTAPGDSSVIETYSSISLSERVKIRVRGPAKSTPETASSSVRRIITSPIIEIDDSDDELAMLEDKPRPKGSAIASSSSSNGPRMPSPNQPAPKRAPLPAPFPFASSPLPPSDPFPHSTATNRDQPEYGDGEDFVPPIATLTAAGDTSFDPASPPSIRKEKSKPRPKPKPKTKAPVTDLLNELLDDLEGQGSGRTAGTMLPPHIPDEALVLPDGAGPSSAPAPGDGAAPTAAPAAKPPKKSRKKQGAVDGEKAAKKPRAKKAKKDVTVEGGEEGAAPKKKGKGKEKEKEVFKSAEYIEDSDEEDAPTPLIIRVPPLSLHSPMDVDKLAAGPSGAKPPSVISIPDSQPDEELMPAVGEKRKRVDEGEDDFAPDNNRKAKTAEKKSKKAKTDAGTGTVEKVKKKVPAKKAKAKTVMSDDDEGGAVDADAMVVDLVGSGSKTAPPAPSGSDAGEERIVKPVKNKKAKKTVLSDSEGEGNGEPVKKKKVKKTVLSDSEGEGDDAFKNKPDVSSSVFLFSIP